MLDAPAAACAVVGADVRSGVPVTDPAAGVGRRGNQLPAPVRVPLPRRRATRRQAVWDEIAPWLHRAPRAARAGARPRGGSGRVHPRGAGRRAVGDRHRRPRVGGMEPGHSGASWGTPGTASCPIATSTASSSRTSSSTSRRRRRSAPSCRAWRARSSPAGGSRCSGPNFRYCAREYFDCADHTIALTHIAVSEHLYAAGFEIERVIPRFLPFSFRSRTPRAPGSCAPTSACPLAWRLVGRQFLLIGRAPAPPPGSGDDGAH